jgi:lysophospholipase L1-like esterase
MKFASIASRLFLAGAVCIGASAVAEENGEALILGDSVSYAYIASVGYEYFYTNPDNFIGFANELGYRLHLDVVNSACPGETSGSFLSATAPDNGCRAFRGLFPLHVNYTSTQAAFATAYLKSHRHVRLVTVLLGANDGLLLEESCASNTTPAAVEACILAGAPALLTQVATNIETILAGLRATGYAGPIVVANYYSLNYADAAGTALSADLNAAIAAPVGAYGAVIADVFTAFGTVAANPAFAGNTCNTGLLNPDVYNQFVCNIHPAQTGHRLIAKTILEALRKAEFH